MLRVKLPEHRLLPMPVASVVKPARSAWRWGKEKHMNHPKRVRLAGSVLDRSRHVCAFFHRKEEEYRVLLPFIKEGFEQGDRAFHIVDPRHRPEHLRRLQEVGIDVAEAERKGQLEVRRWEDAYLRDGHFDQNRMLALIEEVLTGGKAQGFPLTRLVANMEWALEDRPGVDDIVEYETRLNYVLPKYDDAVC
jgi:MEDS: MEthanogen/methylotroph, DcmR Sensory domain